MKKYIALMLGLILLLTLCLTGCVETDSQTSDSGDGTTTDDGDNTSTNNTAKNIVLTSSSLSVKTGEKITISVTFNDIKGVKTFALRPVFNDEYFELVSGRVLMTGNIANFSNGIGVVAFDETIDINNQCVMEFVLKAKKTVTSEAIGCEASVKGEKDKVIVITQPEYIKIEVK